MPDEAHPKRGRLAPFGFCVHRPRAARTLKEAGRKAVADKECIPGWDIGLHTSRRVLGEFGLLKEGVATWTTPLRFFSELTLLQHENILPRAHFFQDLRPD